MSASSSFVARIQLRSGIAGAEYARHSRMVGRLKVALPALAASLLALVVVWPQLKPRDPGFRLTMLQGAFDAAEASRMVNARFVGTDREGQSFTVTADSAARDPDALDVVVLERPNADMALKDGRWLALSADVGRYHRGTGVLALSGDVALHSDDGYEFRAAGASVDLRAGAASSTEPVVGQGMLGVLHAQGFVLGRSERSIRFIGPVSVTVYPPAKPTGAARTE
ncbi:MAG: hypothetical protein EXQ96_10090 [Alphaproteobacteria bacterium]|nr:hypothetical protein [Alphaproteobacteria bacterium]